MPHKEHLKVCKMAKIVRYSFSKVDFFRRRLYFGVGGEGKFVPTVYKRLVTFPDSVEPHFHVWQRDSQDAETVARFTILQGALSILVANLSNKCSWQEPWNGLFQTPLV